MEEQGVSGQNEDGEQKETKSTEKQSDAAAMEDTSKGEAGRKAGEETALRYSRLKLFDKVIQKSLNKFIEHAR